MSAGRKVSFSIRFGCKKHSDTDNCIRPITLGDVLCNAGKPEKERGNITNEDAKQFAERWISAWNKHNLKEILSHYTDDFEMTTPMIQQLHGIESGTLQG